MTLAVCYICELDVTQDIKYDNIFDRKINNVLRVEKLEDRVSKRGRSVSQ